MPNVLSTYSNAAKEALSNLSPLNIRSVSPVQFTYDDIVETHHIETLVLPPEHVPSPEITKSWYERNPLTLLGARDAASGRLIGFFHAMPVSDALFEKIKRGEFSDYAFPASDIMLYDTPGMYKLYIASFCLHPAYQGNLHVFRLIYNGFLDMLTELVIEKGVLISEIVADGATGKGKMLCEGIGMKKYGRSNINTDVYYARLLPFEQSTLRLKTKRIRELMALYKNIQEDRMESD